MTQIQDLPPSDDLPFLRYRGGEYRLGDPPASDPSGSLVWSMTERTDASGDFRITYYPKMGYITFGDPGKRKFVSAPSNMNLLRADAWLRKHLATILRALDDLQRAALDRPPAAP